MMPVRFKADRRVGKAFLAAGCGVCLASPLHSAISESGPGCFTAKDNRKLSFEVVQQAPPPRLGQNRYDFYPLTAAASMQLGTLSGAEPDYARYYFQWGNRSNAPLRNPRGKLLVRKLNLQSGAGLPRRQRTGFSSIARANGCTLAQTANVLGLPREAKAYAQAVGVALTFEPPTDAPVGPQDVCVLAKGRLPKDGAGVLLDYETHDGRTPQQTTAFLRDYSALVHKAGRKAILLINPFDAPTQRYNGITAENAHAIVAMFDRTTIFLWSRNNQGDIAASYKTQKAMIEQGGRFDGARILIDFELAGTSLDDAKLVRSLIETDKLAGVLFWRNGALQGGSCATSVNQKISLIAFGQA
jgi:hypothetical protein